MHESNSPIHKSDLQAELSRQHPPVLSCIPVKIIVLKAMQLTDPKQLLTLVR